MIETKWFHHPPSGSQHTAGGFVTDSPDRRSTDAQTVCHVHHSQEWGRLIAAAPEMLEALEEIAQWVDRWASADHPVATVARKALAAHRKGDQP